MLMRTEAWERVPEYNIGSAANYATRNKSIVRGLAYHRKVYKTLREWCESNPEAGLDFIEEPWLRKICSGRRPMCQPDGVLLDSFTNSALVVEAKLNWKDGRDEKLIKLYLHAVKSAFGLETTWPVLITKNVRGYKGEPLLGLRQLEHCFSWTPGCLTPVLLLP